MGLPQSEFWLALEADVAVGYLHFWTVAGELSLLSMAVVPELRQRGLGRALMQFLEGRSASVGCARLQLEVRVGNAAARSLYSACDYLEVGRRTGYYSDTGEDAVLMTKVLDTCRTEE